MNPQAQQGGGSPAQSAYASALQAIQQPQGNSSIQPSFLQSPTADASAQMTANPNEMQQALMADPRYQQVIGQIGHFLGAIGHPLAQQFNQLHGLPTGAVGGAGQAVQGGGGAAGAGAAPYIPQGVPGVGQ